MIFDLVANNVNVSDSWIIAHYAGFALATSLRYIYRLIDKFKLHLGLNILFIITFSIISGILWYFIYLILFQFYSENVTLSFILRNLPNLNPRVLYSMSPFFTWSIGYWGLKYYINFMDERVESEKMKLMARNAQLQALRNQINPHFLFNSLNSIKALTYEDPSRAAEMIVMLSEFLRNTLKENENTFISIREEIETIEKYLEIEKIRFEKKLSFNISCDSKILDMRILGLLTQPLVENAIRQGFPVSKGIFHLFIDFYQLNNTLVIKVTNSGAIDKRKIEMGIGLTNTLKRLKSVYSDKFQFKIDVNKEFVTTTIEIYNNETNSNYH
jgi:two-component system LytT family sensor kinase